ncbi:MAG: hypothetical protein SF069_07050 [Phycisphaerae bacterium]|nr:hypothetical protein [Phycisphaerae bacterium]
MFALLALSVLVLWLFVMAMMRWIGVSSATVNTISIVAGGCAAVAILLTITTPDRAARKEFERLLANMPQPLTIENIARALQRVAKELGNTGFGASNDGMIATAATLLARIDPPVQERVFRVGPDSSLFPELEPPFDAPFEPTPVDDSRETFTELRGRRVSAIEQVRASLDRMVAIPRTSKLRRWANYVGIVVVFLMFFGLGFLGLISRLLAGTSRREWAGPLIILGLTSASMLWHRLRGDSWFAVPSGLIVLDSKRFSSRTSARLFRRDDCALIWVAPLNTVVIASRDGQVVGKEMSPYEAQFLLRAWLSPVAPPEERIVKAFAESTT